MNFVWYQNVPPGERLDELLTTADGTHRDLSVPPGQVAPALVAELHEAARRELAAPLAEVVLATPEPFIQVIVDVEVPQMRFGRALLLGDAAFVARPHAAAGTAKACDDAWTLADRIANAESLDHALTIWEPERLAVGRQLVTRSREMGDRSQAHDTFDPTDQSLRFGLMEAGDY